MARMLTGRKGASELKRAPNGRRTSSMNCCVLENFLDTADLPAISHVMSSAKMLVMYPVPFAQERNASVTISRLELIARLNPSAGASSGAADWGLGCGHRCAVIGSNR